MNSGEMYSRRRDIVVEVFGNTPMLPFVPEGAFYALIDIGSSGKGSLDFAKGLLAAHDTAVVPGITFGPSCDRYVRVAFTIADDQLREGLVKLRNYIDRRPPPERQKHDVGELHPCLRSMASD